MIQRGSNESFPVDAGPHLVIANLESCLCFGLLVIENSPASEWDIREVSGARFPSSPQPETQSGRPNPRCEWSQSGGRGLPQVNNI